jgi:hypothetical protein
MNNFFKSIDKLFYLDYESSTSDNIWLTKQNTLRELIGILGVLLPLLLWFFLWVDSGFIEVIPSISHYYYTRVCGILVIIVSLLAIFLIVYRGNKSQDFYISSVAGISALLLLLFPTDNLSGISAGYYKFVTVTYLKANEFREAFHYISAAIFLLCLTWMSFFIFPSNKNTESKNKIFIICGIFMFTALLIIFVHFLGVINDDFYDKYCLTFWMETIAIEAFGISWLVKGGIENIFLRKASERN